MTRKSLLLACSVAAALVVGAPARAENLIDVYQAAVRSDPVLREAEMRKMVWSQPSVKHSFYKNKFGEVYILSPWRLVDYWTWTREPNPDDFIFR